MSDTAKHALITGASTGIGWATVTRLREHGWQVTATARRSERLAQLAAQTGCATITADLTNPDDVARLAAECGPVDALVNNAGGALGMDTIVDADLTRWRTMYERNVLATVDLTRQILPAMIERNSGSIVFLTSTAGHDTYPGGGGYVAAKHAERIIANTLRQELVGKNIRIIEIAPGMVKTEEFSLNRLGSQEKADAVYAGVVAPLTAADIAEAIEFTLQVPAHVNIDSMIIRPVAQATNTVVHRES